MGYAGYASFVPSLVYREGTPIAIKPRVVGVYEQTYMREVGGREKVSLEVKAEQGLGKNEI